MKVRGAFSLSFEEYLAGHRREVAQEEQKQYEMIKTARLKVGEIALQLFKRFNVEKVYLFGSLANGEFFEGSDIDLAVTGLSEECYLSAYGVTEAMAAPFKVDLVLLENARASLQDRILSEGVIIFDSRRETENSTKTPGL